MKIDNLDQLEQLLKLVSSYKLDALEVDGIRIVKTKHEYQITTAQKQPEEQDDLLFWSSDNAGR